MSPALSNAQPKLDTTIRPLEFAQKQWDDRKVELVLRAAVNPTALSNTPALAQITTAFLGALVPASAGADLLARGIGLNFADAASIIDPDNICRERKAEVARDLNDCSGYDMAPSSGCPPHVQAQSNGAAHAGR